MTDELGFFARAFDAGQCRSDESNENDVRAAAAEVISVQGLYQPIYGCEHLFENSPRANLLEDTYRLIAKQFGDVVQPQQIRIVDVGCNAGYMALKLSEKFPSTIGIDINATSIRLCRTVSAFKKAHARFLHADLLDLIDAGKADLENVDCILLLNVVHQFIFSRGLEYTKHLIAKIVASVDYVFIELATKDDYIQHGKDHLLPKNPAEVLDMCSDCTVELIRSAKRPFYLIKRKKIRLPTRDLLVSEPDFSVNPNPYISRKYYRCADGSFLKVYRTTQKQTDKSYQNEVNALLRLKGHGTAPEVLYWHATKDVQYILLSGVNGESLTSLVKTGVSRGMVPTLVKDMLRIAAATSSVGLYQNDFSLHNFILQRDRTLRLIDYDQASESTRWDNFAFFLWAVNDLWKGDLEAYRRGIFPLLAVTGNERAASFNYPDLSALKREGGDLADIVVDAESHPDWFDFTKKWGDRFATAVG